MNEFTVSSPWTSWYFWVRLTPDIGTLAWAPLNCSGGPTFAGGYVSWAVFWSPRPRPTGRNFDSGMDLVCKIPLHALCRRGILPYTVSVTGPPACRSSSTSSVGEYLPTHSQAFVVLCSTGKAKLGKGRRGKGSLPSGIAATSLGMSIWAGAAKARPRHVH
jgi:hypothetical protein